MMTELATLLVQALPATQFRAAGGTTYSTGELRQTIAQARWGAPETQEALSARPETAGNDAIARVVEYLRNWLNEYIDPDTDRIGHSIPIIGYDPTVIGYSPDLAEQYHASSSLPRLAGSLIRAATVLGPDPTARLLSQWANTRSWRFRICVLLDGVHVEDCLESDLGLRVYRLPMSSDLLPLSMPLLKWDLLNRVLGHTVLEVDAFTRPAFFRPPGYNEGHPALQTCTVLGTVPLDTFWLALSLVCNRRISLAWSWNDYGEAGAFIHGRRIATTVPRRTSGLSSTMSYDAERNLTRLSWNGPSAPNLCAGHLHRALELLSELQQRMDSDSRFRIAVTRWARAVSTDASYENRVIDLRIALESIYLDSDNSELGFRLAVTGARYLGETLAERKAIRKSLAEFYRLASRVIHGTDFDSTKNSSVTLVDTATKLCCDSILKIVEQRNQPDWTDILLS